MGTGNRPESEAGGLRTALGGVFVALYFAFAPSSVPDWRSDPGFRTVAVLPIGEPVASFDSANRR